MRNSMNPWNWFSLNFQHTQSGFSLFLCKWMEMSLFEIMKNKNFRASSQKFSAFSVSENTIVIKFNYFTKLDFCYPRNRTVQHIANSFRNRPKQTNERRNEKTKSALTEIRTDIKKEMNNAVLFHSRFISTVSIWLFMCSKFGYM